MADILHEFTVTAPPEQVYRALTEQHGLSSWLTLHTVAQPKVNSVADEGTFPSINYARGSYLTSLKAYVETHQGSPYSDPA